ncbi:unnamed protein product [Bursaphelenchus xylophilus]|uniref:(pine wood nematode) hypothetical protein n=1 Tax=Bursaphelenchus xylophilus TaxID=6326 RepID=A0A1I7SX91_BURXY|nr:unnamed protein product [Bursaphelenchus xylophilus]CAG9100260.1 unnamed protein product [Bursaphelenchus xylophilus]
MVGRSEMWTLFVPLLLLVSVADGQNGTYVIYNPPMVNINKNGDVPCHVPMSLPVAVKGCKEYDFNMVVFEKIGEEVYYCSGVNLTTDVPYNIVFNRTCNGMNLRLTDSNSLPCIKFEFDVAYTYTMTVKFTDEPFRCPGIYAAGVTGIYPFKINRLGGSPNAVDKFDSSADIFDAFDKIVSDDIQAMEFNPQVPAEVVTEKSAFQEFVDPFLCDSSCFWFALGATIICLAFLVACLIVSGRVGNSRTSPKGKKKAKAAKKSMKSKASAKEKKSKASKTKKSANSKKESKASKSKVESKVSNGPNNNIAKPPGSSPDSKTGSETNIERTPAK